MLQQNQRLYVRKFICSWLIIFSIAFTLILSNQQSVTAQSITGLNSEISNLRSRINRLESEIRSLKNVGNNSRNMPNNRLSSPNGVVDDRVIGKSDPLTERLATLLIELKEDVRNIEGRLEVLENE